MLPFDMNQIWMKSVQILLEEFVMNVDDRKKKEKSKNSYKLLDLPTNSN